MAVFVLKTGQTVVVDDEDLGRISTYTWHIVGPGYVGRSFRVDGKTGQQYLHHFILGKQKQVDHRNGDPFDNRKSNLRFATNSQNQGNSRTVKRLKTSRFKGVYWERSKQKWHVQIGRPREYLGYYSNETDAAKAYDVAAIKRWGQFAKLNFE